MTGTAHHHSLRTRLRHARRWIRTTSAGEVVASLLVLVLVAGAVLVGVVYVVH